MFLSLATGISSAALTSFTRPTEIRLGLVEPADGPLPEFRLAGAGARDGQQQVDFAAFEDLVEGIRPFLAAAERTL